MSMEGILSLVCDTFSNKAYVAYMFYTLDCCYRPAKCIFYVIRSLPTTHCPIVALGAPQDSLDLYA